MKMKLLENKNIKMASMYLIANFLNKGIVFLTIPIFTRLLNTSEYGIVNTYLSWVSILATIVTFSVGSSLRNAFVDFEDDIDCYISSIMLLSIINFLFTSSIIYLIIIFLNININPIIICCLIHSFMSCIIETIFLKYMMEMQHKKRAILMTLPNIVILIFSIILIVLMKENKHMGRIISYVLVYTIIGLGYLIIIFTKSKFTVDKRYWKYAMKISIPLIFHGLSMVLLSQVDRTMITFLRNSSETGVYSLVYNFSMISLVFVSVLEGMWIPWFTEKIKNGEFSIINENAKIYLEIITVIMFGILMISPEVLVIMAPVEYLWGKILIAPILLGSFFMFLYSISVNLEYYYKSTKSIAISTVIAALINIILNLIFIPIYGALAASITTIISYIISFLIHYKVGRRIEQRLFPIKIYTNSLIIMILGVIFVYVFMDNAVIRWIICCIILFWYLVTRINNKSLSNFLK